MKQYSLVKEGLPISEEILENMKKDVPRMIKMITNAYKKGFIDKEVFLEMLRSVEDFKAGRVIRSA